MFSSERFNLSPRLSELLDRSHQLKITLNKGPDLDADQSAPRVVYCEFQLSGELQLPKQELQLAQLLTGFRDSQNEGEADEA